MPGTLAAATACCVALLAALSGAGAKAVRPLPDTAFFTYKKDLINASTKPRIAGALTTREINFRHNVLKTLELHPGLEPRFLTDDMCLDEIRAAGGTDATLLQGFFSNEKRGMYRADMCRCAALRNHGGYYFDIDLHSLADVRDSLPPNTTFATCRDAGSNTRSRQVGAVAGKAPSVFFQAFMAAVPGHPVLGKCLTHMRDYYLGMQSSLLGDPHPAVMGTWVLGSAYDEWVGTAPAELATTAYFLQEDHLMVMKRSRNINLARLGMAFPRQAGAYGKGCNYVVYDPQSWSMLFYSRIAGSSSCRRWNETSLWPWDLWNVFYQSWGGTE